MTPTDPLVAKERARQDLEDIAFLKECAPFKRYWLRRVTARRDALVEAMINDPAERCSPAKREEMRQQILLLKELLGVMDADQASARREMGRQ
jgi:hypothetical protein